MHFYVVKCIMMTSSGLTFDFTSIWSETPFPQFRDHHITFAQSLVSPFCLVSLRQFPPPISALFCAYHITCTLHVIFYPLPLLRITTIFGVCLKQTIFSLFIPQTWMKWRKHCNIHFSLTKMCLGQANNLMFKILQIKARDEMAELLSLVSSIWFI